MADETAAQADLPQRDINEDPEKADGFAVYAPIGRFTANAFGLHDVIGNVSEYCLDGYVFNFYDHCPRIDPVAPWEGATRMFQRGGSWSVNALRARSSFRDDTRPNYQGSDTGVRPARDLER